MTKRQKKSTIEIMQPSGPLIVQSDLTILLDVHAPDAEPAREALGAFAALEKSPEHVHQYRISPLSLWNASAAGLSPDAVIESLEKYSRYDIPRDIPFLIRDIMSRFGALVIREASHTIQHGSGYLELQCRDEETRTRISSDQRLAKWLDPHGNVFLLRLIDRGTVKVELLKRGYPVKDEAPLHDGSPLEIALKFEKPDGKLWSLRPYQEEAVNAFLGGNKPGYNYGVIVLPCGSGKTIVGMAAMAAVRKKTLIITTNIVAVHQWRSELLDKTNLGAEQIGEYTGAAKELKPVTIATYQILSWRPDKESDFPHFDLLRKQDWGLIICDEVHLLPAPVFRVVAEMQAVRRLGLTATLVREDGREDEVFSLIGPKRYDVPWKILENKGFIAEAFCKEIRIPMDDATRLSYAVADRGRKLRIAAENPLKDDVVRFLLSHHTGESILIIGQYISQVSRYAAMLDVPLITGTTPDSRREELYGAFRRGEIKVLVTSKVANFAIDLPDASVAIQISGTFGSRQEEAQRLGRILRPKEQNSFFYSLVSRYSVEEEYADNRRKFLVEQGYRYSIEPWEW